MAQLIPFKGFRYDPARVDIEKVVAPPYDVISDEERDFLYERHPNNIIRLIRGKEMEGDGPQQNKYTRASLTLKEWMAAGILRQDKQPSIYVYEQEYRFFSDKPTVRRGFIALARLEEQESGVILGHEQTMMAPKYDRLNLMKECRANLSPIFSLFSEPEGSIDRILAKVSDSPPAFDLVDDKGVRNRLWVVSDAKIIESLCLEMWGRPLIIADGHHRYETALIYRHIRRSEKKADSEDAPYNYVMMMFANLYGAGMTIYPVHRIVYGIPDFDPALFRQQLEQYFELTPYSFTCSNCEEAAGDLLRLMRFAGESTHAFGLYLGGKRFDLLTVKDDDRLDQLIDDAQTGNREKLDVTIAQTIILRNILGIGPQDISKEEHVRYTPAFETALEAVRRGEAQIALLLNATKPDQVKAVTREGKRMPQKSTFFYPKLLSGLVINRFDS